MTTPNDPPAITDVRQIPGHDKAPDFMLHAIQAVLDARGEIRTMNQEAGRLYQELVGPDGLVSQVRKELGRIGEAIEGFTSKLASVETHLAGQQTQLRAEVTEIRGQVEALSSRIGQVEQRVTDIEQSALSGGASHS